MRISGSTFGIFSRSVKDRKLKIQNENLLIHVIETHVSVCNQVQKTKKNKTNPIATNRHRKCLL